jgi:hypothetical protein
MTIRTQDKVLTAIVGSYPKPRYVYRQSGRSLLDSFGFAFERRQKELGQGEFAKLLDNAAFEAIQDQNRAGIDIMTDGEEKDAATVPPSSIDWAVSTPATESPSPPRAGTSRQDAPRLIGKIQQGGRWFWMSFYSRRSTPAGTPR